MKTASSYGFSLCALLGRGCGETIPTKMRGLMKHNSLVISFLLLLALLLLCFSPPLIAPSSFCADARVVSPFAVEALALHATRDNEKKKEEVRKDVGDAHSQHSSGANPRFPPRISTRPEVNTIGDQQLRSSSLHRDKAGAGHSSLTNSGRSSRNDPITAYPFRTSAVEKANAVMMASNARTLIAAPQASLPSSSPEASITASPAHRSVSGEHSSSNSRAFFSPAATTAKVVGATGTNVMCGNDGLSGALMPREMNISAPRLIASNFTTIEGCVLRGMGGKTVSPNIDIIIFRVGLTRNDTVANATANNRAVGMTMGARRIRIQRTRIENVQIVVNTSYLLDPDEPALVSVPPQVTFPLEDSKSLRNNNLTAFQRTSLMAAPLNFAITNSVIVMTRGNWYAWLTFAGSRFPVGSSIVLDNCTFDFYTQNLEQSTFSAIDLLVFRFINHTTFIMQNCQWKVRSVCHSQTITKNSVISIISLYLYSGWAYVGQVPTFIIDGTSRLVIQGNSIDFHAEEYPSFRDLTVFGYVLMASVPLAMFGGGKIAADDDENRIFVTWSGSETATTITNTTQNERLVFSNNQIQFRANLGKFANMNFGGIFLNLNTSLMDGAFAVMENNSIVGLDAGAVHVLRVSETLAVIGLSPLTCSQISVGDHWITSPINIHVDRISSLTAMTRIYPGDSDGRALNLTRRRLSSTAAGGGGGGVKGGQTLKGGSSTDCAASNCGVITYGNIRPTNTDSPSSPIKVVEESRLEPNSLSHTALVIEKNRIVSYYHEGITSKRLNYVSVVYAPYGSGLELVGIGALIGLRDNTLHFINANVSITKSPMDTHVGVFVGHYMSFFHIEAGGLMVVESNTVASEGPITGGGPAGDAQDYVAMRGAVLLLSMLKTVSIMSDLGGERSRTPARNSDDDNDGRQWWGGGGGGNDDYRVPQTNDPLRHIPPQALMVAAAHKLSVKATPDEGYGKTSLYPFLINDDLLPLSVHPLTSQLTSRQPNPFPLYDANETDADYKKEAVIEDQIIGNHSLLATTALIIQHNTIAVKSYRKPEEGSDPTDTESTYGGANLFVGSFFARSYTANGEDPKPFRVVGGGWRPVRESDVRILPMELTKRTTLSTYTSSSLSGASTVTTETVASSVAIGEPLVRVWDFTDDPPLRRVATFAESPRGTLTLHRAMLSIANETIGVDVEGQHFTEVFALGLLWMRALDIGTNRAEGIGVAGVDGEVDFDSAMSEAFAKVSEKLVAAKSSSSSGTVVVADDPSVSWERGWRNWRLRTMIEGGGAEAAPPSGAPTDSSGGQQGHRFLPPVFEALLERRPNISFFALPTPLSVIAVHSNRISARLRTAAHSPPSSMDATSSATQQQPLPRMDADGFSSDRMAGTSTVHALALAGTGIRIGHLLDLDTDDKEGDVPPGNNNNPSSSSAASLADAVVSAFHSSSTSPPPAAFASLVCSHNTLVSNSTMSYGSRASMLALDGGIGVHLRGARPHFSSSSDGGTDSGTSSSSSLFAATSSSSAFLTFFNNSIFMFVGGAINSPSYTGAGAPPSPDAAGIIEALRLDNSDATGKQQTAPQLSSAHYGIVLSDDASIVILGNTVVVGIVDGLSASGIAGVERDLRSSSADNNNNNDNQPLITNLTNPIYVSLFAMFHNKPRITEMALPTGNASPLTTLLRVTLGNHSSIAIEGNVVSFRSPLQCLDLSTTRFPLSSSEDEVGPTHQGAFLLAGRGVAFSFDGTSSIRAPEDDTGNNGNGGGNGRGGAQQILANVANKTFGGGGASSGQAVATASSALGAGGAAAAARVSVSSPPVLVRYNVLVLFDDERQKEKTVLLNANKPHSSIYAYFSGKILSLLYQGRNQIRIETPTPFVCSAPQPGFAPSSSVVVFQLVSSPLQLLSDSYTLEYNPNLRIAMDGGSGGRGGGGTLSVTGITPFYGYYYASINGPAKRLERFDSYYRRVTPIVNILGTVEATLCASCFVPLTTTTSSSSSSSGSSGSAATRAILASALLPSPLLVGLSSNFKGVDNPTEKQFNSFETLKLIRDLGSKFLTDGRLASSSSASSSGLPLLLTSYSALHYEPFAVLLVASAELFVGIFGSTHVGGTFSGTVSTTLAIFQSLSSSDGVGSGSLSVSFTGEPPTTTRSISAKTLTTSVSGPTPSMTATVSLSMSETMSVMRGCPLLCSNFTVESTATGNSGNAREPVSFIVDKNMASSASPSGSVSVILNNNAATEGSWSRPCGGYGPSTNEIVFQFTREEKEEEEQLSSLVIATEDVSTTSKQKTIITFRDENVGPRVATIPFERWSGDGGGGGGEGGGGASGTNAVRVVDYDAHYSSFMFKQHVATFTLRWDRGSGNAKDYVSGVGANDRDGGGGGGNVNGTSSYRYVPTSGAPALFIRGGSRRSASSVTTPPQQNDTDVTATTSPQTDDKAVDQNVKVHPSGIQTRFLGADAGPGYATVFFLVNYPTAESYYRTPFVAVETTLVFGCDPVSSDIAVAKAEAAARRKSDEQQREDNGEDDESPSTPAPSFADTDASDSEIVVTVHLGAPPEPEPAVPPPLESAASVISLLSGISSGLGSGAAGGAAAADMQTLALLGISDCAAGKAKSKKSGFQLRMMSPTALDETCSGVIQGNFALELGVLFLHFFGGFIARALILRRREQFEKKTAEEEEEEAKAATKVGGKEGGDAAEPLLLQPPPFFSDSGNNGGGGGDADFDIGIEMREVANRTARTTARDATKTKGKEDEDHDDGPILVYNSSIPPTPQQQQPQQSHSLSDALTDGLEVDDDADDSSSAAFFLDVDDVNSRKTTKKGVTSSSHPHPRPCPESSPSPLASSPSVAFTKEVMNDPLLLISAFSGADMQRELEADVVFRGNFVETWVRAFDRVRFPALSFVLISFLQSGFFVCAVEILRYGMTTVTTKPSIADPTSATTYNSPDNTSSASPVVERGEEWFVLSAEAYALGIAGIVWTILPIIAHLIIAFFLASRAYYPVLYHAGEGFVGFVLRFILPSGQLDKTIPGTEMFSAVVGKFQYPNALLVLCSFFTFFASAPIVLGSSASGTCRGMYITAVVLHMVFAAVLIYLRPFRSPLTNLLQPIALILNGVIVMHYLSMLDASAAFTVSPITVKSLGAFLLAQTVLSVLRTTQTGFQLVVNVLSGTLLPQLKPFPLSCSWEVAKKVTSGAESSGTNHFSRKEVLQQNEREAARSRSKAASSSLLSSPATSSANLFARGNGGSPNNNRGVATGSFYSTAALAMPPSATTIARLNSSVGSTLSGGGVGGGLLPPTTSPAVENGISPQQRQTRKGSKNNGSSKNTNNDDDACIPTASRRTCTPPRKVRTTSAVSNSNNDARRPSTTTPSKRRLKRRSSSSPKPITISMESDGVSFGDDVDLNSDPLLFGGKGGENEKEGTKRRGGESGGEGKSISSHNGGGELTRRTSSLQKRQRQRRRSSAVPFIEIPPLLLLGNGGAGENANEASF